MQSYPINETYKKLNRWPKVTFKSAHYTGKVKNSFDFQMKYLGEKLAYENREHLVLKVEDPRVYRDITSHLMVDMSVWCWATPQWSVIECNILFADRTGSVRSIYSPYDSLIQRLLSGENIGLAIVSATGDFCVYNRYVNGLPTSSIDDLDSMVLKSFLTWTEKETNPIFRRMPIEVTFFSYLIHRSHVKNNPEPLSHSLKLSLSWSISYAVDWERFYRELSDARDVLESNPELASRLSHWHNQASEFPEFTNFSRLLVSDARADEIVAHYEQEERAALILTFGITKFILKLSKNNALEDDFSGRITSLIAQVFQLTNKSPEATNLGRKRIFWTSGCSVDDSKRSVLNLDVEYMNQHSEFYWAQIVLSEIFSAAILKERDIPLDRSKASIWIQEIKCELSVDQVLEQARANVGEIRFAKKWTIPWGARVEIRFGNFRYLEVYDQGGEFITLFRDSNDRYLFLSFQPEDDVPWATVPLFFEKDGRPENLLGQALLFLVASSAIRDFCVVEEREVVFDSRVERVSKVNRPFSADTEQVIYIPRVRYRRFLESRQVSTDDSSVNSASRALHEVKAHLRKADKASIHQIVLASRYGLNIPRGYTFVRPHQRGGYAEEYLERKKIYRSRSISMMLFESAEVKNASHSIPEWFKFERDTEKIFEAFGWEVLERKPHQGRGDGGVDVLAFDPREEVLWVAQCKCYRSTIQPDKIRELIGVLAIRREAVRCRGLFLTTSKYSSGALELALSEGIELIDGAKFVSLLEQYSL